MKQKNDVFKRTERRLTVQYSGLLLLFLALFIIVVYALVYAVVMQDQHRELRDLTKQETRLISRYVAENTRNELWGMQSGELVLAGVDQLFYYVTDQNGSFVMGSEALPGVRSELLSLVAGWMPEKEELREETVQITFAERRIDGMELEENPRQETVRVLIDGSPIFYNNQFIGMLYIGKDITFVYQLMRWLLVILASLAVLFAALAVWLSRRMSQKAMEPIAAAYNRQREFVGDASHELRTPLSVMLSSIDALGLTDGVESDPLAERMLGNMRKEVKRMTALVGDLLVLARADSGSVALSAGPFDLVKEAEEAIESIRFHAESNGVLLTVDAPGSLTVSADRQRIRQLLLILLDNAVKYSPDGGNVRVTLGKNSTGWLIQVVDEGIGLAEEDQTRIFDRFFRVDQARTRTIGGHGLGLPIAKWIAELHNGSISVVSESGKGSTFTVEFPE